MQYCGHLYSLQIHIVKYICRNNEKYYRSEMRDFILTKFFIVLLNPLFYQDLVTATVY